MAALARAGVPLERGLTELGGDLPGRLGRLATGLAERMGQGQSLTQAMADCGAEFPAVYRAVVAAGLRAGRLSAALEAVAGSIRRLAELRRALASASLYPLVVLVFGWLLFAFFCAAIAPHLETAIENLGVSGRLPIFFLARLGHWALWWGPAVPLIVVGAAVFWWRRSARAVSLDPTASLRIVGWTPWLRSAIRWSRAATFADALAMLVDNEVPLPEALLLAADTAGDRPMREAARLWASDLNAGDSRSAAITGPSPPVAQGASAVGDRHQLPALLQWILVANQGRGSLLPGLRHASETYRRRAAHQAELARVLLPVILSGVIGVLVLVYAVMIYGSYAAMLWDIGRQ